MKLWLVLLLGGCIMPGNNELRLYTREPYGLYPRGVNDEINGSTQYFVGIKHHTTWNRK